MYEMAKKAREAMRGKAKRLAGEKDQKVDSSNWTPAEPLNADVKTGMRPISKQGFKDGGKIAATHAGRKPRKSGGRAITADSLINRDQKEANEGREGKKHIGGMQKGGRTGKAMGGSPTDMLKGGMNPAAYIKNVLGPTMGLKKGGRAKHATDGKVPARTTDERIKNPNPSPDYQPSKPDPDYKVPGGPSQEDKDALTKKIEGLKKGGRAARKAGGNVNYGPMEMPAGKKGPSTAQQIAEEKREQGMSKPKRGKAGHYADGGMAPYGATAPVAAMGPDPKSIVQKNAMNFGMGTSGSPYKKGGKIGRYAEGGETTTNPNLGPGPLQMPSDDQINKENWNQRKAIRRAMGAKKTGSDTYKKGGAAKFEGSAKDEAQDKKLAKKHGMSMKAWESSKMDDKHDKQESMKGLKSGGRTAKFGGGALSDGHKKGGKGKTNINILINPGSKPDAMGAGAPGMPPGLPPKPIGGIPVPMGMPPAGGAAPMPMPMPMPSAPAPGGMPPMGRKAGGKVYRTYKDLDAGAGSGLGRLEKTEIQKRKG